MDTGAFRVALGEAIKMREMSQQKVAVLVSVEEGRARPYHQSMVSDWLQGTATPSPQAVFALERALELPPGHLSEHLGYLPAYDVSDVTTVAAAIDADPTLDNRARRALKNLYATLADDGGGGHGGGGGGGAVEESAPRRSATSRSRPRRAS